MKFGVGIPTCRQGFDVPPRFCSAQELAEVGQFAEKFKGVDFIWGSDFLTPIPAMKQKLGAENLNWYELVVSMSYLAAATKRVGLGFGVVMLPFRDPFMLAKQIATLDALSNGRVIFGVGLGAIREEYEMIFANKAKANRGDMLDEEIQILRSLFNDKETKFEGKYFSLNNVTSYPKPAQKPLPMYIAGRAEETVNRIVKWGDGWVMGGCTPEDLGKRVDTVKKACEAAKRDFTKLSFFADSALCVAKTHEEAVEKFKNSFVGARFTRGITVEQALPSHYVGTPAEIAETISKKKKAGATHIVAQHIAGDKYPQLKEQIQMFAEEVVPLCK